MHCSVSPTSNLPVAAVLLLEASSSNARLSYVRALVCVCAVHGLSSLEAAAPAVDARGVCHKIHKILLKRESYLQTSCSSQMP